LYNYLHLAHFRKRVSILKAMDNTATKVSGLKVVKGNFSSALFLAFKSIIKGNKWASILLILVMAFSFVNLNFVSSLISGIMKTMDNQIIQYVYGDVVIAPQPNKYYIEDTNEVLQKVAGVQGVVGVTSRLNNSAFIEYNWQSKASPTDKGQSGNWEVVGIDPVNEPQVTMIDKKVIAGQFINADDRDQIVLGVEIAGGPNASTPDFQTLGGAKVGDKVRLTYPNGIQKEYTIKGLVYTKEGHTDRMAIVSRAEMISVMGQDTYSDRSTQILVKKIDSVKETTILTLLNSTQIDQQVKSWNEYGGSESGVVSTFSVIGSLIGGVGLVVSATVMFIIIYISVLNKKRQIGILRAIGIPSIAIIGSYIFQAFFFAAAGTLLGWSLVNFGLIPYFQHFPLNLAIGSVSLSVPLVTVLSSALGLSAAGVLAGWIPSWTIMRQSIIKAVWGN
jgi:putative ABC transport system permease protein